MRFPEKILDFLLSKEVFIIEFFYVMHLIQKALRYLNILDGNQGKIGYGWYQVGSGNTDTALPIITGSDLLMPSE
jgi:hypothetical protein